MSSNSAEKEIAPVYGLLVILYAISAVCLGIPFYHWKASFEMQKGRGCILHAVRNGQKLEGSGNSGCMLAMILPIVLAVYSFIIGVYHLIGVIVIWKSQDTEPIAPSAGSNANEPNIRKPPWKIFGFLGVVIVIITVGHFLFCIIGYYKTCNRYDDYVIMELNITGIQAELIRNRLSCDAIYSYMDYIHKVPNVHRDVRDRILTASCLMTGILASLCAAICWILLIIVFYGQVCNV